MSSLVINGDPHPSCDGVDFSSSRLSKRSRIFFGGSDRSGVGHVACAVSAAVLRGRATLISSGAGVVLLRFCSTSDGGIAFEFLRFAFICFYFLFFNRVAIGFVAQEPPEGRRSLRSMPPSFIKGGFGTEWTSACVGRGCAAHRCRRLGQRVGTAESGRF